MNTPDGYTYDGDEYCPDCLPVSPEGADVAPLYAWMETGGAAECCECGSPIVTLVNEVAR